MCVNRFFGENDMDTFAHFDFISGLYAKLLIELFVPYSRGGHNDFGLYINTVSIY